MDVSTRERSQNVAVEGADAQEATESERRSTITRSAQAVVVAVKRGAGEPDLSEILRGG